MQRLCGKQHAAVPETLAAIGTFAVRHRVPLLFVEIDEAQVLIELVCLILYVIPATTVFGAVLLTGYLGGAVATHVRIGSPLFTHTLFPIYVGVLLWGGLLLRDQRLRALVKGR